MTRSYIIDGTVEGSARGGCDLGFAHEPVSYRNYQATFLVKKCGLFCALSRRLSQTPHVRPRQSRCAGRAHPLAPLQSISKTLLVRNDRGPGPCPDHLADGLLRAPGRPQSLRAGAAGSRRRPGRTPEATTGRGRGVAGARPGRALSRQGAHGRGVAPIGDGLPRVAAGFGKPAVCSGAAQPGSASHPRSHVAGQPGAPQHEALHAQGAIQ